MEANDISDLVIESIIKGLEYIIHYLEFNLLNCLLPAFFIAGAILALVKRDTIAKYLGPNISKARAYITSSLAGTLLAVCSCMILPLFAGIYKKGASFGPSITFLFAGPAINIFAIAYTTKELGIELGLARTIFAIIISIFIGIIMAYIFRKENGDHSQDLPDPPSVIDDPTRPRWAVPGFFLLLIAIMMLGASHIDLIIRVPLMLILILFVITIILRYFTKIQIKSWGNETWKFTKSILPILVIGMFIVGMFAYLVPPESFSKYLQKDDILSDLLASLLGSLFYVPPFAELSIFGDSFTPLTNTIASGPALALLISGPTTSIPTLAVLCKIMGVKKTFVYWALVVISSTMAGVAFGIIS